MKTSLLVLVALSGAMAPLHGAVWTVVTPADAGTGSLRWAIDQANGNAGPDEIRFNLSGAAPHAIELDSQLPHVEGAGTRILGETQPGATGQPAVFLNGRRFDTVPLSDYRGCGIVIFGNDCAVSGLGFQAFSSTAGRASSDFESSCGVRLHGANGRVSGCTFGFGWNGAAVDGQGPERTNCGTGVLVRGASNVVEDSVFGFGGIGVRLAGGSCRDNQVRRCRFGQTWDGLDALSGVAFGSLNGLGCGVAVTEGALRSQIGGPGAGNWFACNVGISSAGGQAGLSGLFCDDTTVRGNRFGLGLDGRAVPQVQAIQAGERVRRMIVGGSAAGEENYFCGQQAGPGNVRSSIQIDRSAERAADDPMVSLIGNVFGLNPAGEARPNGWDAVVSYSRAGVTIVNNTVRHGRNGVVVKDGASVGLSGTTFGDLSGLAVDNVAPPWHREPDGATPFDLSDEDAGGNDLMNQPVLQSIAFNPITFVTTVQGHVFTRPGRTIRIQLFSSPWNPAALSAARLLVDTTSAVSDGTGAAAFSFALPGFHSGRTFTAFATDLSAALPQTSELSDPLTPASGRLRIATASLSLAEGGAGGSLRIVRTGGSYGPATATLQITGSAVVLPGDCSFPGGLAVSFANGEVEKVVSVSAVDDALYEEAEFLTIGLSNVTGALGADSAVTLLSIRDNDPPPLLAVGDRSVNESAGTVSVPVSLSVPAGRTIEVSCTTLEMSARAGGDFTAMSTTLVFTPGETSRAVVIPIVNDASGEGTETFGLRASTAMTSSTGIVTITDDDTPPVTGFRFTGMPPTVPESTAAFTVRIERTGDTGSRIDLIVGVRPGTAEATDIFGFGPYTATFLPGQTTYDFGMALYDDDLDEDDEEFFLEIEGASSGGPVSVLSPAAMPIKILDNDDPPKISAVNAPIAEGNSGTLALRPVMSFSLNHASEKTVSFMAMPPATLWESDDFWLWSYLVVFPPGATTATLDCGIFEDLLFEDDESMTVTFSGATNGQLTDGSANLTLLNDDADERRFYFADPTGALAPASMALTEAAGSVVLQVMRAGRIDLAGQVELVIENSAGDVVASEEHFTFEPGEYRRELTVSVIDDSLYEGTETITLKLKPADGVSDVGIASSIDLVIADNDPLPEVTVTDVTVAEGDAFAVNAYFTYSLSAPSGRPVKLVGIATVNDTASNADYGAVSIPELIFAPGETTKEVRVIVAGDWLDELPEQFFLDVASANGATLARSRAVGLILDNDLKLRPYRNWLATRFTPVQRADDLQVNPCADPDGDGLSNGTEFVLDTDPRDAASGPPRLALAMAAGRVRWEATVVLSRAADFELEVQESPDLVTWSAAAPPELTVEGAGSDGLHLRWEREVGSSPRSFLRLATACPPFSPEP